MGNDILSVIVKRKMEQVVEARSRIPENRLRDLAETRTPDQQRPFFQALANPETDTNRIIAEIKRASPSKGDIRPDLDPITYAQSYETGGATALSVLTDSDFFKGSPEDLKSARAATSLPVLRKDFVVTPYQIYESAVLGADAILLITRILSDAQLQEYIQLAQALHLDVLVEVHTRQDIEKASRAGARLVGINNRNLKSFETTLDTAIAMKTHLEPHQVPVAESGIHSPEDIVILRKAGFRNFLIGESLVRAADPVRFLRSLVEITG